MEIHSIPSRSQIFLKEQRKGAKSSLNEKYRYFNRQFLTLPVTAKDLGNKSIRKNLTNEANQEEAKTNTKTSSQTANPTATKSKSPANSDEDFADEARDTIIDTKAIVHVFNDDVQFGLANKYLDTEKRKKIPQSQIERQFEALERISSASSDISIGPVESLERQGLKANERSLSIDSDVIIGIFEGVSAESPIPEDVCNIKEQEKVDGKARSKIISDNTSSRKNDIYAVDKKTEESMFAKEKENNNYQENGVPGR